MKTVRTVARDCRILSEVGYLGAMSRGGTVDRQPSGRGSLEQERDRMIVAAHSDPRVADALRVFNRVREIVPPPFFATRVASVKFSTVSG